MEVLPFLNASVPAQVQRIQSHLLFEYLRFSERQMVSLELVGMTGIFNELVTKKLTHSQLDNFKKTPLKRMISHKFRQMGIKKAKLAVLLIYRVLAFSRASAW